MVNQMVTKEIGRLKEQYQKNWGAPIDFNALPRHITQEKLCLILRRIVNTGESVLVGYDAIHKMEVKYYDSIDWTVKYKDGDSLSKACPFCGAKVYILFYGKYNQSHVVHCETQNCLLLTFRGL